jgi:hypothetical protein
MAYFSTTHRLGLQPLTAVSSTADATLGTVVTGKNSTYGVGEFIYLLGVSGTANQLVTYNATTWQTTLSTTGATGNGNPVAVMISANAGGQYGWHQIGGLVPIKKTAVAIGPQLQLVVSGTAGRVYGTYSTGKGIVNAKSANLATIASATSTIVALIDRPSIEAI